MARQFEKLAGISMNRVPFRSGLAGHAGPDRRPGAFLRLADASRVVPQYQAKQLKIIGVTSPERLKAIPDVPTLKEKGIDYVRYGFLGICAPRGHAAADRRSLNRHIVSIVATPEYRELIEKGGSLPESSTPAGTGASHRTDAWTTLRLQSANSECSRSDELPVPRITEQNPGRNDMTTNDGLTRRHVLAATGATALTAGFGGTPRRRRASPSARATRPTSGACRPTT